MITCKHVDAWSPTNKVTSHLKIVLPYFLLQFGRFEPFAVRHPLTLLVDQEMPGERCACSFRQRKDSAEPFEHGRAFEARGERRLSEDCHHREGHFESLFFDRPWSNRVPVCYHWVSKHPVPACLTKIARRLRKTVGDSAARSASSLYLGRGVSQVFLRRCADNSAEPDEECAAFN
jgi:hypothetical protein